MGKAMSVVSKPLRDFNLESRAHKVISQKPKLAPKYERDFTELEKLKKDQPKVFEEADRKDETLDKFLRDIYVTSRDPVPSKQNPDKTQQNPNRPLPFDKSVVPEFEFGVKEPDFVPPGRITLRKALQLITDHQTDPQTNTFKKLSDDYRISEEKVENILKYYKVFQIYIPEQREVKAKFAGPSIPKKTLPKRKLLEFKKDIKENT